MSFSDFGYFDASLRSPVNLRGLDLTYAYVLIQCSSDPLVLAQSGYESYEGVSSEWEQVDRLAHMLNFMLANPRYRCA